MRINGKNVKDTIIGTFTSLGIKGNFCFLGVPNLLVGSFYHVKNEGCLLDVLIMRLFNQTLSIYANPYILEVSGVG